MTEQTSAAHNGDVRAVEVVVRGRVQGVFFRANTREKARQSGVRGWVRNEPDGSVRAVLEGPAQRVDEVLDWMRSGGPKRARVEDIDVAPTEPHDYPSFSVEH